MAAACGHAGAEAPADGDGAPAQAPPEATSRPTQDKLAQRPAALPGAPEAPAVPDAPEAAPSDVPPATPSAVGDPPNAKGGSTLPAPRAEPGLAALQGARARAAISVTLPGFTRDDIARAADDDPSTRSAFEDFLDEELGRGPPDGAPRGAAVCSGLDPADDDDAGGRSRAHVRLPAAFAWASEQERCEAVVVLGSWSPGESPPGRARPRRGLRALGAGHQEDEQAWSRAHVWDPDRPGATGELFFLFTHASRGLVGQLRLGEGDGPPLCCTFEATALPVDDSPF